jgi:hypothetical protein
MRLEVGVHSPLPVHQLKTNAKELQLEAGQKVYHLPDWHSLSHPERLVVIRQIAMMRGRDPRIAQLAVKILKDAKAKPRDYKGQAAAILQWVQNPKNVYYVNEPGERLQDPVYTMKIGHGDCDDMILVLSALYESIGLPWKLVLSGRDKGTGKKVRYIEGSPIPQNCSWVHIYGMVGDRPFQPGKWYFTEPTVDGVPLGWDVIDGDASYLPEMGKAPIGNPKIVRLGKKPRGTKVAPLPPRENRSPAYSMGYGDALPATSSKPSNAPLPQAGATVAGSVASTVSGGEPGINTREIMLAITTGIAIAVGTNILQSWLMGEGRWQGKGTVMDRVSGYVDRVSQNSLIAPPVIGYK